MYIEPIQKRLKEVDEANQQRHLHLLQYLDQLKAEAQSARAPEFTVETLNRAQVVWERIKEHFREQNLWLEVPDACPGCRDNLMYTWSRGEHYLECEIFGNGAIEFFYRNKNTEEVWGEDIEFGQEFSTEILNKIVIFT